jgi:hypothetical protein
VSEKLLRWADLVLVMETAHKRRLHEQFPDLAHDLRIEVLDIPDDYPLAARLSEAIGLPFVAFNDAQAAAWGEPVPRTAADVRALAAKGRQLLDRYHETM